jgi:hypothetical protein
MKLVQFINEGHKRSVGIQENGALQVLRDVQSVYELSFYADHLTLTMEQAAENLATSHFLSIQSLIDEKKILLPLDHPDPYHCWLSGTGLTHLGSAASRNAMHQKLNQASEDELTDSMRMFKMGLADGKMKNQIPGVQPEWFYKGNGLCAVAPYRELPLPAFAMDGGEEPEIVSLYIIRPDGQPKRIGFALANEFSDHKMEKINYLYLAHSKLRYCSYGPEIHIGNFPSHVVGKSSITRNQETIWEKHFLTGEDNMTHNLENLEYHHFKYDLFRQPGDVHVHFLGTSVLSFADNFETAAGDAFHIEADCFDLPLINQLSFLE